MVQFEPSTSTASPTTPTPLETRNRAAGVAQPGGQGVFTLNTASAVAAGEWLIHFRQEHLARKLYCHTGKVLGKNKRARANSKQMKRSRRKVAPGPEAEAEAKDEPEDKVPRPFPICNRGAASLNHHQFFAGQETLGSQENEGEEETIQWQEGEEPVTLPDTQRAQEILSRLCQGSRSNIGSEECQSWVFHIKSLGIH